MESFGSVEPQSEGEMVNAQQTHWPDTKCDNQTHQIKHGSMVQAGTVDNCALRIMTH